LPQGVIKGPDAESSWKAAVAAAQEQYPGLKSKDSDRFYAIVMTIYKKMCKNKSCTPKSEGMGSLLRRIEESAREHISKVGPVGGSMHRGATDWMEFVLIPGVKDLFRDYNVKGYGEIDEDTLKGYIRFSFEDTQGVGLPKPEVVRALIEQKYGVPKRGFRSGEKKGMLVVQSDLDFSGKGK